MLAETPPEAFNANSLFVDAHQIVERTNEPKMTHMISKKECQRLYPHHDGRDGELFYGLLVQFRDRHFAEKLISCCDFDFSLAHQLGTLCHGNIFLLDQLCVLFSNDLSSALRFLNCFSSSLSSSSSFLLSSQFLSHFENDVSSASSFLARFSNNGSSASSFLARFNNGVSSASSFLARFNQEVSNAVSFLAQFNNNASSASSFLARFKNGSEAKQALKPISAKFSEESSFKLAVSGCNGDISAVEAFCKLSGIQHLELLFDSELHPRNAQEFHSRCDAQGPTVSFVCSSGNCVCGVVHSSWISPPPPKDEDEDEDEVVSVSDPSAYLLRLSPNPRKFSIRSDLTDYALFCHSDLGPCFGSGSDFGTIFDTDMKFPKGMCGLVRSGWSYNLPENAFLFPTTDAKAHPIDRIVVCKFTPKKL